MVFPETSFTVLFYAAAAVCVVGLVVRAVVWLTKTPGALPEKPGATARAGRSIRAMVSAVFSRRIGRLVASFVADVVLLRRSFQTGRARWLMHMLVFYGFVPLLIFHALGRLVTDEIFSGYMSTINPYLFIRDLFGVMVLAGLVLAVYRRALARVPRLYSNRADYVLLAVVGLIIVSGFVYQAAQITSERVFDDMVQFYAGLDPEYDAQDIADLRAFWVSEWGLVSDKVDRPIDAKAVEYGADVNASYCTACHVAPRWAFGSYAVARVLSPVAGPADNAGWVTVLKWIHLLACFLALALLPFTKLFHMVSTPLSLLVRSAARQGSEDYAVVATRQAMELDACTHCGTCSLHCRAMMGHDATGNPLVLPGEKMALLKRLRGGKTLSTDEQKAVIEGIMMCTNCDRCTVVCPSGINLREMWLWTREELVGGETPDLWGLSPLFHFRALCASKLDPERYQAVLDRAAEAVAGRFAELADPDRPVVLDDPPGQAVPAFVNPTFSACFGCQTCTTVCPVVACHEDAEKDLGLVPHQIMMCLGLDMGEMASGCTMIWECTTCYLCQESCPQGVRVCDLLYDLKNLATRRATGKAETQSASPSTSAES